MRRAAVVGLGLISLAGCGSSTVSAPAKRLTKAQLIERGDAVCTEAQRKNRALRRNAPAQSPVDPQASDETVRKAGPVLEKLADNVRDVRRQFSELSPPRAAETRWERVLGDLDTLAQKLDATAAAAYDTDRQGVVDSYSEALKVNRRVTVFEVTYGFQVCGTGA